MELTLQSLRSPSQTMSLTVIDSATLIQCRETVVGCSFDPLFFRSYLNNFDMFVVVVVVVKAIPLDNPVIV